MSYNETWIAGEWAAICDICGFKVKSSELRKRWDGLMVCEFDWENRHPQDFIRARPDQFPLPFTRPEPDDRFVSVVYLDTGTCTALTILCQADYGGAGCMTVGQVNGNIIL